jgi:hypothetical protein
LVLQCCAVGASGLGVVLSRLVDGVVSSQIGWLRPVLLGDALAVFRLGGGLSTLGPLYRL